MESCASEVLWRNSWVLSWTKIWPRRFSHGAMSAMFMFILPRSLTARLWKKMVGKRSSFWEGLFSGASCSTSGVYQTFFRNIFSIHPKSRLFRVFLIIRNDKKRSLKKVFQSPPKMISPGINQNINKPHTHTDYYHHCHNHRFFAWPTTCRGRKVLLLKVVFFSLTKKQRRKSRFCDAARRLCWLVS